MASFKIKTYLRFITNWINQLDFIFGKDPVEFVTSFVYLRSKFYNTGNLLTENTWAGCRFPERHLENTFCGVATSPNAPSYEFITLAFILCYYTSLDSRLSRPWLRFLRTIEEVHLSSDFVFNEPNTVHTITYYCAWWHSHILRRNDGYPTSLFRYYAKSVRAEGSRGLLRIHVIRCSSNCSSSIPL